MNQRPLQRLADARKQQGLSTASIARRLGVSEKEIIQQERPESDPRISELFGWQSALEMPLSELLPEGRLSNPVLDRARVLRLARTAIEIRNLNRDPRLNSAVQMLLNQILEVMPDLERMVRGERL